MADIATFVTGTPVEEIAILSRTFTATTAVKAGQVVAINATGVSNAVDPCVATGQPVGVALTTAAAGATVNVCMLGICYVTNADDTVALDAGDLIIGNDNAVGGTVSVSLAVGTQSTPQEVIGIMLEDMAGGAYGKAFIFPMSLTDHA